MHFRDGMPQRSPRFRGRCRGNSARALGVLLLAVCGGLAPAPVRAANTDTVILKNGDRISGEVKGLSRGKLDYSTDDAGRLSIEWDKVARVTSIHAFDVETFSGATYFGRLVPAFLDRTIVVEAGASDTLRIEDVVEMAALDAGFLQRVKAYLDVGFTLAKAHHATTFNMNGETDYRGEQLGSTLEFDSYSQGQDSVARTARNSASLLARWFLPDRWSAVALTQYEHNDELGLDHRWTAGAGASRVIKHTNSTEVEAGAALVGIWERYLSAAGGTEAKSLDALLTVAWDKFRFDSPKLDFSSSFALYPSLSDFGRVRGELQLRVKYEVFRDFHAGVNFTDSFDSRPPDETVSKNDYITSFTIGWSYRR